MEWVQGLVENAVQTLGLAIVQGVTEFLPVSSTAHLVLMEKWLDRPLEEGLLFVLLLHAGTLAAVWLAFPGRYWGATTWLFSGLFSGLLSRARHREPARGSSMERPEHTPEGGVWFGFLVIGSLPLAFAGAAIVLWLPAFQESLLAIALANILFGLLLGWADLRRGTRQAQPKASDALFLGCAQALALFPGVSRSGVVMTAAMMRGWSRRDAAELSLMLGAPAIALALLGGLAGLSLRLGTDRLMDSLALAAASAVAAFVVASLTIRTLLAFAERVGYGWFVLYRLGLGALLLWLWFAHT